MFMIPPQYFWPGLVVSLLLFSIGWSTTILVATKSDGGPQVLPSYYERTVNYENEQRARIRLIEQGWQLRVNETHSVLLIEDRAGNPVSGLTGIITFRRPFLADDIDTVQLHEQSDKPGHYAFEALATAVGLWDLGVVLFLDEEPLTQTLRINVRQ